jgi:3-oxoacyl-[acyl-carrier protein] reductase
MDLDLRGRHALVCGGSDGIGRAAAEELARMGCDVTLLARNADSLAAAAAQLPRSGAQVHDWIAADAGEPETLRRKVEAAAAAHPFQILVNNSGGPPGGPAHAASADDYSAAFRQQLLAAHAAVQAVLPGMRRAAWGRIVNVVSTSVREPIANLGVSNTVRGAVAGWAKTLSRELGPSGITVNNVLPGYTRTRRLQEILGDRAAAAGKSQDEIARGMLASVPAGRFAEPAEIAAAIAFLASPAAGYVNGVSLAVDGGRMQSI